MTGDEDVNPLANKVVEKERLGMVRGIGSEPIPSLLFGLNSQQPGEGAQTQETQRVQEELQAKLMAEKLKRHAVESEVVSEKAKFGVEVAKENARNEKIAKKSLKAKSRAYAYAPKEPMRTHCHALGVTS
ncbi:hypothetical protein PIB30_070472 [Stylosanthes scabra]|uniref:Uncharacterized protein n=1 Tax=Stylosanthes scabra TaxID=79078 RepID=A0ABU6UMA4_9FABA|nr:hypothetical protein [Stylosanthes scabra]